MEHGSLTRPLGRVRNFKLPLKASSPFLGKRLVQAGQRLGGLGLRLGTVGSWGWEIGDH